jgi:hypothetical protein
MNFVAPEHISSNSALFSVGSYSPEANTIGLNLGYVKEYMVKEGYPEELTRAYLLIHEEGHAVQKVRCYTGREFEDYNINGYIRSDRVPGKDKRFGPDLVTYFHGFGEGVTDRIALEVTEKYAAATNLADRKAVEEFKEKIRLEGPYKWQQHIVDVVINKLSRASGISPDIVWQAIKAGAYRGDDLYKGELREFLDEELGAKFMSDLQDGNIRREKVVHNRTRSEQRKRDVKATVLKLVRKIIP